MYYHMFVKSRCSFCKEAKDILKKEGVEHVISSMDNASMALNQLKEKTNHRTVPIIFQVVDNQYNFIGGCQELKESLNAKEIQESTTEAGEQSSDEVTASDTGNGSLLTDSEG